MVSRPERDRRPWSLGALALSSCFDTPDPPWLLDDSVEILAVRADVIEDGPASRDLGPVPADRLRSEALPGDVVHATILAASLDGIAVPEEIDAAWFMCRDNECVNELRDDAMLLPCGPLLAVGEGCALGRGSEMTFVMPPLLSYEDPSSGPYFLEWVTLGVVLGTSDGPTTDDCVERMGQRPYPSLAGCSLFQHRVRGGPTWKVLELSGVDEMLGVESPPELAFLPPAFSPEVQRFAVDIRSPQDDRNEIVDVGGRVTVAPGDLVTLTVDVDPRDLQSYLAVYAGEPHVEEEFLFQQYFADVPVSTKTEFWTGPFVVWTAPSDVASVSIIATIVDSHGGVGWGSITFDVAGSAP